MFREKPEDLSRAGVSFLILLAALTCCAHTWNRKILGRGLASRLGRASVRSIKDDAGVECDDSQGDESRNRCNNNETLASRCVAHETYSPGRVCGVNHTGVLFEWERGTGTAFLQRLYFQ